MKKNIKVIILSLLVIFSIILEVTGVSVMLGSSYAYIIKPVIWIFIGIIAFIFFQSERLINTKYKKDVDFIVIVAILLYYLIYFLLGYVKGFANNPYDTSIRGMLLNLWSIVPIIISREYIRCYIVNNCNQKKILWWTLIVSLVFTIIELNFNKFPTYFGNSEAFLKFIMQTFIPSLMVNLFLSYLSYFSGVFAPIVYALVSSHSEGGFSKTIANGKFECTTEEYELAVDILDYINSLMPSIRKVKGKKISLVNAIIWCYKSNLVDLNRLANQVETFANEMTGVTDLESALTNLEKYYNYNLKKKENIVYLVTEWKKNK